MDSVSLGLCHRNRGIFPRETFQRDSQHHHHKLPLSKPDGGFEGDRFVETNYLFREFSRG